jgi:hypothetical protein
MANQAPTAPKARISPSEPTTELALICGLARDAQDPEGGALSYRYLWTAEGRDPVEGSRLEAGTHVGGETWMCSIWASDGELEGEPGTAEVTIGNTPPIRPVVSILPADPSEDDDLQCVVDEEAVDLDGQELSMVVSWEVEREPVGLDGWVVAAELTTQGEEWGCTVVASDGEAESEAAQDWVVVGGELVDPVVAAGHQTSCAVQDDGVATCWGSDAKGLVSKVPEGSFTDISLGWYHACVLESDSQELDCWGMGSAGEGHPHYGQDTPPGGQHKALAMGAWHGCAITVDGELTCWGIQDKSGRDFGQVRDAPEGRFASIHSSAVASFACALDSEGRPTCWGEDGDGQVSGVPLGPFVDLAVGRAHACGLEGGGGVQCWGDNGQGQGSPLSGLFSRISAGEGHTCGLRGAGAVRCWGDDSEGQTAGAPGGQVHISAGFAHSCAIDADSILTCWGLDDEGQSSPP